MSTGRSAGRSGLGEGEVEGEGVEAKDDSTPEYGDSSSIPNVDVGGDSEAWTLSSRSKIVE